MKRIRHLLVCLVLILCSIAVFTSCDNSNSHTHTYSSEWTTDANYHWNNSTCGCTDEISNKALHDWDEGVVTTPATCTTEGEKTYTCISCKRTKIEAISVSEHTYSETWENNEDFHWHEATCTHNDLASGFGAHSWNEGVITTPATCTTEGVKTYTCTVCEKTKTEAVSTVQHTYSTEWSSNESDHWHASTCGCDSLTKDKNTHSWNEGVITTPATCTTEGVKTYTCTVCEKTKTEAVPTVQHTYSTEWSSNESEHWHASTCGCEGLTKDKNTHTWDSGVITTPATCTTEGVKTYTCTVCEKTKTEAVPIVQHTYSTEWSSNESEHWHALTCGCIAELKDKAEHTWDSGVITTPATCTVEGVKTFICTVCEKTKTEAVPTLQHTYSTEWSSDENEHWHASTCGCDNLTKDKNTHSWNEGVITTPATCTTEGVKTFTCTVCEKTKTEAVPAVQHTYSTEWSSNESEHWHASTCGCDSLTKDKNTHSWNEGVITTPATCTAEGVKTYTCTVCEKTKTEAVPTVQHTYSTEWSSDENEHWHAATCGCDSLTKDKNTHSWNEGVITTPATCTAEGVKTYTCTVCEKTKTEAAPTVQHTYSTEWSSNESEHWHAATCGCDSLTKDKNTHSWNEGVITTPATCTAKGIKTYTCTVCGQIKTEKYSLNNNTTPIYQRQEDTIYFGSYPQSKVTDSSTITSLNAKAGNLPTSSNSNSWTSYNYYISGAVSDYMWYIDVEYNSKEYRGVYFTSYRPCFISNDSNETQSKQDDYGYYTNNVYWFVYEPISWTIINESDGSAILLCNIILDYQTYFASLATREIDGETIPASNYKYSDIRAWLNDEFFNTAFSKDEKDIILDTLVDNSAASTDASPNSNACENTIDKIFMLSYSEVGTYFSTNAERIRSASAYALSQGASTSDGQCSYGMRSPCSKYSASVWVVGGQGQLSTLIPVTGGIGILPAIRIQLDYETHSYETEIIEPTCTTQGYTTYTCRTCGESYTDNFVEANGHNYGECVSNDDGTHTHVCVNCSTQETLACTYSNISIAPTCTEKGFTTYTCNNCNFIYNDNYVNALGHDYVDGICSKCGGLKYSEGLEYTLDKYGSYYTVTGIGTCTDTEIFIPTTYNDKPVKAIGPFAFYDNNKAWKVIIPTSVTTIEYSAFEGSSVVAVVIGENVTTIQSNAFSGEKLIEIHNKSNCSITSDMYRYTPLNIYSSSGTSKVFESDGFIFYESGSTCYLVGYCGEKTELTLPSNCNSKQYSIYQWAFYADQDITSITISSGVKSIGEDAFRSCNNLETVIFEEGITKIEDYAFIYCSGVKEIILPESLTTIGVGVFQGCSSMKTLYFGKNVSTIGKWLIWGGTDSLDTLLVHQDNLTFYSKQNCVIVEETGTIILGCKNSVIPTLSRVQTIGEFAFVGCTIESITIPSNITLIDYAAFQSCEQLKEITFSEGLTTIGNYAFHGCKSLVSVDLPDTLTWIGLSFDHCSSLTSITFGANQTWTGAFSYCDSLEEVTIPATIQSISSSAFEFCKNLKKVNIASGVTTIASEAFYYCTSLVSITLPDSVETIGADAFSNCTSLKTIKFSQNLREIGEDAFYKCSALTGVTLPTKLQKIGRYAFYNCTSITSLTIPNSVTTISEYAFSGCSALTTVTIGSGVNYIGGYAFSNTGLTSATFYYTSGWWGATTSSATSGTSFTFSTASEAAKLLKTTYLRYYWHRG